MINIIQKWFEYWCFALCKGIQEAIGLCIAYLAKWIQTDGFRIPNLRSTHDWVPGIMTVLSDCDGGFYCWRPAVIQQANLWTIHHCYSVIYIIYELGSWIPLKWILDSTEMDSGFQHLKFCWIPDSFTMYNCRMMQSVEHISVDNASIDQVWKRSSFVF